MKLYSATKSANQSPQISRTKLSGNKSTNDLLRNGSFNRQQSRLIKKTEVPIKSIQQKPLNFTSRGMYFYLIDTNFQYVLLTLKNGVICAFCAHKKLMASIIFHGLTSQSPVV